MMTDSLSTGITYPFSVFRIKIESHKNIPTSTKKLILLNLYYTGYILKSYFTSDQSKRINQGVILVSLLAIKSRNTWNHTWKGVDENFAFCNFAGITYINEKRRMKASFHTSQPENVKTTFGWLLSGG